MKEISIIVLLFVIIILLAYLYKANSNLEGFISSNKVYFYNKDWANNFLKTEECAINYMNSIEEDTIKYKIRGSTLLNDYYNAFSNFTETEEYNIKYNIGRLPQNRLLDNFTWKFVKTNENLEMGMPYTLKDIIFLPTNLIGSLIYNKYDESFAHTLCHEAIHVLQRLYPSKFNEFIKNVLQFSYLRVLGNKPLVEFVNPDGPQSVNGYFWCFNHNGAMYCPFLELAGNGTLMKPAVKLDKRHNDYYFTNNKYTVVSLLKKKYPFCPANHLYHPNEILAEMGANYLMYGTSRDIIIDKFYDTLLD